MVTKREMSYEDYPEPDLEVGALYWYECRRGWFEFTNGSKVQQIDLKCVNDPYGGPPYWIPPYDHDANPFPKCVLLRKYNDHQRFNTGESIVLLHNSKLNNIVFKT